jgi:hypothetical protein
MKSAAACPAGCVWSNGAEMIPEKVAFCAPEFMTDDYALIKRCAYSDDNQCNNGCKMRRGKDVASNKDFNTANTALFESNFCHPPTTVQWDEKAPSCLKEMTQLSCEEKQCIWSTGKELTEQGKDACLPEKISVQATDYSVCSKFDTVAACAPPQCKWYTQAELNKPVCKGPPKDSKPGMCGNVYQFFDDKECQW